MNQATPRAAWSGDTDWAPDPARRAAWLLHSLNVTDRAWMLSRLSAAQVAEVQPMLSELKALSMPAMPEVVARAAGEAHRAPGAEAEVTTARPTADAGDANDLADWSELIRSVDGLPARVVATVLDGEPDGLVRSVLQLWRWSWRTDVARAMAWVEEAADDRAVSAGSPFGRLLMQELLRRARACKEQVEARPSRWAAMSHFRTRWFGGARRRDPESAAVP